MTLRTPEWQLKSLPAEMVAEWWAALEHELERATQPSEDAPLHLSDAIRHAALSRGKRLRAMLMLAVSADLGQDVTRLFPCAAAAELLHTASLILDDLPCMDDAVVRRDQLATHRAFGEATAILATIALVARSYAAISDAQDLSPAARSDIISAASKAIGAVGLSGGQYDDLSRKDVSSVEELTSVYARKTGALFALVFVVPALADQFDDKRVTELWHIGQRIGVAFQIYDDLVDAFASEEHAGKDVRKDADKMTLQSLIGAGAAMERADAEVADAQARLKAIAGDGYAAALVAEMARTARARAGLEQSLKEGHE